MAGAAAWGRRPSICQAVDAAALCRPKQLPIIKDTKGPEKNFSEPESVIDRPSKNHCGPGSDPETDGGQLLTGEAKKSTAVLYPTVAPGIRVGDSLMQGWAPPHPPLVTPGGDGPLTEMPSQIRESYVHAGDQLRVDIWGNENKWAYKLACA